MKEAAKLGQMLEAYEVPAILVTSDYEIIATNKNYEDKFGSIDIASKPHCYQVSHGYNRPCDQAGEDCPLRAARESQQKESVLHIHQTPNGREHVDVEMIPILDQEKNLSFFVELLKPVPLASGTSDKQKFIGNSPAFEKLIKSATRVAKSDANVLLLGESGTGKELVSHMIHLASERCESPMVTLECAGLSETLVESELFGHKKGAFTDAHTDKIGLVEHANGGTLFLDEIGDISLETQVKLLRLIESKTFRRVGGTKVRSSDFRLICATHRDLKQMIKRGEFRLDLYYRINVFPIAVPSLTERRTDIPALAKHMISTLSEDHHITEGGIKLLQQQSFEGNIRELRNLIQRAIILCDTNVIDKNTIQEALLLEKNTSDKNIKKVSAKTTTLKQLETSYLLDLIDLHEGDKQKVADQAGISLRTLYRKLDNL